MRPLAASCGKSGPRQRAAEFCILTVTSERLRG